MRSWLFLLSGISTLRKIAHGKRYDRIPVDFHMFTLFSPVGADHSKYSSPFEAINLTAESKALAVELKSSTVELYQERIILSSLYCSLSVEAKETVATIV